MEFVPFPKIPRLSRDIVVTEKIDGTNASIFIGPETVEGEQTFRVGSRTRWITPQSDNYGFAAWAEQNKSELVKLGPGHHFGEWYGLGISRGYGLFERRFALFNSYKWSDPAVRPKCCHVVPVLYQGPFSGDWLFKIMSDLHNGGSQAVPGYMKPEGIVIYHTASRSYFKKTLEHDEAGKEQAA
jgi:hypothetical protein